MNERIVSDKNNKQYYENIYKGKAGPKKKTKLDRMADYYRQSGFGKKNSNNVPGLKGRKQNLISLDDSNDNIIRNDSDNDLSRNNIISNDIIPSGGMKEKDDDIISTGGMKEKDNDILSLSGMKEKDDDSFQNDILSTSALNKGMIADDNLLNLLQEDNDGEPEADMNDVIRQKGMVTEDLANHFMESNSFVSKGKKFNNFAGFSGNIGKGANSLAQIGMILDEVDIKHGNNIYSNIINPAIGGGAGLISTAAGAAGVYTGIHDTRRNFHNVDAGGERMEYVNSAIDTLGSGTAMTAGALTAMQNAGGIPVVGSALKSMGSVGGDNLVPGLNIVTGGATALTGAYQGITGFKRARKINSQIEALEAEAPKDKRTKDQEKLLQIFRQGKRTSEIRRNSGAAKFISGAIIAGTGIALASGPVAPLALALLAVAGAGVGIGKYFYDKRQKRNLRKTVTSEEMGIDWVKEEKKVRNMFKDEDLSDKEVRAIILKGHGYQEGTRTAAFKQINLKRAETLINTAKGGGPDAEKARNVIRALGVHRRKGRYAEGSIKLLAEKLAG